MAAGELAGWAALVLAIILGALLFMQTGRLGRVERQFRALTTGLGSGADRMSLAELVSAQGATLEAAKSDIQALRTDLKALDILANKSLQRVGLVRYNPFQEAGGDQSFALALLDKRGDGLIISSLHSRTSTRFYAKSVKGGTPSHSLSDEEMAALKQALE